MYVAKSDRVGHRGLRARSRSARAPPPDAGRGAAERAQREPVLRRVPADRAALRPTSSPASKRWCAGIIRSTGRVMPDDFVHLAEQTGLINPLTTLVLETAHPRLEPAADGAAARRSRSTCRRGPCRIPSCRGGSPTCSRVYDVPPESLALEITENILMSDPARSMDCLNRLHDMGVRIVIDDFGTGYSSLSYLRRLPIDELKIDRSFVAALVSGPDDVIVRSTIDLAHNLGLRVVAEGVESDEVQARLDGARLRRRAGHVHLPARVRPPSPRLDRARQTSARLKSPRAAPELRPRSQKSYRDNPLQGVTGEPPVVYFRSFRLRGSPFLMPSLFVLSRVSNVGGRPFSLCWAGRSAAVPRPRPRRRAAATTAAKPVKVEAVREETVERAVDVVGTLAAVDQVTISSEADGKVSRILADLGDRVTAGQVLVELDHEKQQYNLEQQQAALARDARAVRRARPAAPAGRSRRRRTCRRPTPTSCRRSRRSTAPASSSSGTLVPQQALDDAADGAAVEAGELRLGAAEREEPARRASRRRRRR